MRKVVVLAPIVAALVAGCPSTYGCDPEPTRIDASVYPGEAELAAALDQEGELTAQGCEALCSDVGSVETVHGCERAAGGATDTGGEASEVLCDVTVTPLCLGRDHVSIAGRAAGSGDAVGLHLADAALAEATSVRAFLELGRELDALGAPDLAERCRAAALDEVAHARIVGGWAREHGARMGRATFRPTPTRDLLALAIENAVEGCVNETYAALVAAHQSVHAAPEMRAGYARIAADEARHAELAWAMDAWALARLDAAGRAVVEASREAAISALFKRIAEPDPSVAAVVGLPSAAEARRLLTGLVDQLWAPLAA